MGGPDDPIAQLWVHAMRAELDALVTRTEAQLRQHVAATAGARREEIDALEQQVAAFAARLQEAQARGAEREAELARQRALGEAAAREIAALHAELDRARAEARAKGEAVARLESEGAAARAELERLQGTLREMGSRVQSLDEQFTAEKAFVAALTRVAGTLLFDVAQLALGQSVEPSPACYGALKARKPDALLAAVVRERGRTVARHPLTEDERVALAAMAHAAGCELIEVPAGARFTSATMEKAATRPEPADEDHVLECVMPGVRLAGTQGAVVHPRVVVATA